MQWFLCVILCLCATMATASSPPQVVVSIKPLHSLVASVMGDTGEPMLLVSGAASPHDFQLKPSQMQRLRQARLIFYVDDGLEVFLHRALTGLPEAVQRVAVAERTGIALLPRRAGGAWEAHPHCENHHHAHGHADTGQGGDPHLWLNPDHAIRMVAVIAEALSQAYPEHQVVYARNAAATIQRIHALDARLRQSFASVQGAPFIVFHDAYQYLERKYGLQAVGAVTLDPEESPPPGRVIALRVRLKATGVQCVFREPGFSERLVQTLTDGSTAQMGVLDPEGTQLTPGRDLYVQLMEGLAESMVTCLTKPGKP
jgi:zinc transport system substrate-binding protein